MKALTAMRVINGGRAALRRGGRSGVVVPLVFLVFFAIVCVAMPAAAADKDNDEPGSSGDQVQTSVIVTRVTNEQLLAFEMQLDDLRDQIFDAKARLLQLRDQVMYGSLAIISIKVTHTQEVSSAFAVQNVRYTLDGFEIFNKDNANGQLDQLKKSIIYEGAVLPGEHLLTIDFVFQGRGYGVFSYMNSYLFKVKSRYSFKVEEDKPITLAVRSYDKGGSLGTLKSRLKVDVSLVTE